MGSSADEKTREDPPQSNPTQTYPDLPCERGDQNHQKRTTKNTTAAAAAAAAAANLDSTHCSEGVVVLLGQVDVERLQLEGVQLVVGEEAVPVRVVDSEQSAHRTLEQRPQLPLLFSRQGLG